MDKIKFITFDNGKADTCQGCVYDGPSCIHPSGSAPLCVGGIYVGEQEPVQQTITEQEEQKRVKYVALTLFNKQGYFTESVVFDSQKEAEKWLVGNYQDRSAVSFEIVEMEY